MKVSYHSLPHFDRERTHEKSSSQNILMMYSTSECGDHVLSTSAEDNLSIMLMVNKTASFIVHYARTAYQNPVDLGQTICEI